MIYVDWIATTIAVLRNDPRVTALLPPDAILARYATPADPPRLLTVVLSGGSEAEPLLSVTIDVRAWAETGAEALHLWQAAHAVLSDPLIWAAKRVTRWRLLTGPTLLPDPDIALTQVAASYQAFAYPEAA